MASLKGLSGEGRVFEAEAKSRRERAEKGVSKEC